LGAPPVPATRSSAGMSSDRFAVKKKVNGDEEEEEQ
jgi:hypothetical protein